MDLHAWITQQVECVDMAARAELTGHRVTFVPNSGRHAVTGTITATSYGPDGLNLIIDQHGLNPVDDLPAPLQSAAATLRRCETDRRILARHAIDPAEADSPKYATACKGCERWGEFDYPNTSNLNDCPELLDLAHAHGLTDEILAGLDRPQAPERGLPEVATSDVPAALRGPHWKP